MVICDQKSLLTKEFCMSVTRSVTSVIKKVALATSATAIISLPALPILNVATGHADTSGSYTTLSSFSGHPDALIVVSGGNYSPNEMVTIVATQNGSAVASTKATATSNGQYSANIQLPAKLAQGGVTITATGITSGLVSSNSYYATPFSPSLVASSSQTTPYGTLGISGSGYAPDEIVDLNLAGATTKATTNSTGSFSGAVITTPAVPAASYTIVGGGEASGASAVAYEYINGFYPNASPSSYYVMPATSLGFTGSGFAPNETVTVTDAKTGAAISSFTADATGSFKDAGAFSVPASYAGLSKTFLLTGSLSKATTTVTTTIGQYYPNVNPTAYYLLPGKTLSFNGSGFIPGETVDITSGTTSYGSVVADKYGNLTAAGAVVTTAAMAGTNQTFTLTGETSHGTSTVTVQIGSYNPVASPSGYYVLPGTVVTFSGTGYAPSEVVTVFNGLTSIASFSSDATGSFVAAGATPIAYTQAGTSTTYKLVGAVSKTPNSFTISVGQLNTQLTPTSYYVLPYATFGASATGFAPNEVVTLTNGKTVLGTATANTFGTATFTSVSLPYSMATSATLTATGTTSGAVTTASVGLGNYNATVTASNYYAKPGDTIALTGNGFAPNESVSIVAGTVTQTVTATAKGTITASLVLPFGQTKSSLSIVSTGAMSHASSTTTITLAPYLANVSPSTYYAQPGTPISFTGSGFLAGETLNVTLNGVTVGTETANSMGNLTSTGTYSLPYGKTAVFVVTGATSGASVTMNIGLAQFYAGLQLSSYYGNGGSVITATGSGFAPNELIQIQSGTTTLEKGSADAKGNFSYAIQVPYVAAGKLNITATGSMSGASAATSYSVAQAYNSVGLGSYAVPAGSAVTITGTGFYANEPITVTGDRLTGSYTFNASATGTLNNSGLILPAGLAPGMLTLTIDSGYSFTSHAITLYVQ
jgi:hypothetical protein